MERRGLLEAPPIRVIAGEERHGTIDRSLRLLGLGTDVVEPVPAGPNGAIDLQALRDVLRAGSPGRDGVAALVGRCCAPARRFAEGLASAGLEVANEVVLNQVLRGPVGRRDHPPRRLTSGRWRRRAARTS